MIYYDDRPCGAGKTMQTLETICRNGGRHIYAVDRAEAANERIVTIREKLGSEIITRRIFAANDHRTAKRSVCSRIEGLPFDDKLPADVIIFISHEALKLANFEDFRDGGWTLWIDEVPSVLDTDRHRFSRSWALLAQMYELRPIGRSKRARVFPRDDAPNIATLAQDDALEVLRPFHRRVTDPRCEVIVDIRDWRELSIRRKEMTWYSLWSPDALANFDVVFMLGNALTNSISYRLWQQAFPHLKWQAVSGSIPAFVPRKVTITYFAEAHRASTSLFDKAEGVANLNAISRYLRTRVPDDRHIWMCNEANEAAVGELPGTQLSPRKAGSNSYAYANYVTTIYKAKPDASLRAVYRDLGIDPEGHTIWCECETILQFVCRSSIRTADDPRAVEIFVYDRVQAQYLSDHFQNDPRGHLAVEMVLENLGFAHDVRDSRPGRKAPILTLEELEAKKAATREKDKLRKRDARAKAKIINEIENMPAAA